MTGSVRRPARVGRKVGTQREWDRLANAVAALARNYRADVTVCVNTRGEVNIVIGGDGTRLTPVIAVTGQEDRPRIETTWQLRRDGYARYRQVVPAMPGRPSDKVGSRTAPAFLAAQAPDEPAPEAPPPAIEDGPVYTVAQRSALRRELGLED